MQLKLEHVKKSFDTKEVLTDVSYEFESGKIYGLLGRNGSGKTTLFNCIDQNLRKDGGSCILDGHELAIEEVAMVPSTPRVPEFMTGREFLKFFTEINTDTISDIKTPDEYLDIIGIKEEDRELLLKDWSHGMQSKIQMLVNIIIETPVLLLDEPLTSLDVVAAEEMKELLRQMKADRVTIFSTHILDLATDLCDEIVLLHHGELSAVDKAGMDDDAYKDAIIAALRDEEVR